MKQSGNALFLILIAVALFAALSYAVTQSSRGGGAINKEQSDLVVSQFFQYASSIEAAILKLKLFNGCADNEFSFEHPSIPAPIGNSYNNGFARGMKGAIFFLRPAVG